jgi:hypothetical protein
MNTSRERATAIAAIAIVAAFRYSVTRTAQVWW